MNCQRCKLNEARYRAFSDILDMKVCDPCAKMARELKMSVEPLPTTANPTIGPTTLNKSTHLTDHPGSRNDPSARGMWVSEVFRTQFSPSSGLTTSRVRTVFSWGRRD